jgi:MYXO-CTERM domain-containing protein
MTTLAMALLWGGIARADVVPPPPTSCLDGSLGKTCHGGPYCAPVLCHDSSSCAGGKTCRPTALCIDQLDCFGRGGGPKVDRVVGSCELGALCGSGICQSVQVCASMVVPVDGAVPDRASSRDRAPTSDRLATARDRGAAGDASDPSNRRGCRCTLSGDGEGLPWALLAVAVLLGWRRACDR